MLAAKIDLKHCTFTANLAIISIVILVLVNSFLIILIKLIFGGLRLCTRHVEGARDGISGSLDLGTTINSAAPSMVRYNLVCCSSMVRTKFSICRRHPLGVPSRLTIPYIRAGTAINCPLSRAPFTSLASYKIVTEEMQNING